MNGLLKIQVACPAYTVTGGPEALHQLVHTARHLGFDARIVYQEQQRGTERSLTAEPFRIYDIAIDDKFENDPKVLLVVPEAATHLLDKYDRVRKAIWWLSIDNYAIAATGARRARRWWKPYKPLPFSIEKPDPSVLHFAQSEYARNYLREHGLGPAHMLTDYLRDDFMQTIATPSTSPVIRQPRVAYNPKKGLQNSGRIAERATGQLEFVRIENMTPSQVVQVLRSSMVYMDFGHHPGRDRIPREAAACGCCVLTGRQGSAANPIDIPIPDEFKLEETSSSFVADAVATLKRMVAGYEALTSVFEPYRHVIADQKHVFEDEVQSFLEGAGAVAVHR